MGNPGSAPHGATAMQQPPELITSLNLVKGSSDEERFAGLLMLMKYLNSSDGKEKGLQAAGNTDVRRQVLEAVKLEFLIRLLRSPNPNGPPEGQNIPDVSAYQAVAVTILSCLAQDAALVPCLTPALPDVFILLTHLRDLSLLSDVFFLVYSAAKHNGPVMAAGLASSDVLHLGARTLERLQGHAQLPPELIHQACTALHEVVSLESSEHIWQGDGRALGVLVQVMAVDRSELKLGLVPIVALLLATRRHYAHGGGATGPLANLPVGFGSSLRVSLVQLLHGGLREAHRDSALAILVHGMALFGQGWAVEEGLPPPPPPPTAAEEGQGDQLTVGIAVAFFVHALAMEVRMASEELEAMGREDGLAYDDTTSDKHEAQVEKRRVRALALLPLCLDGLHSVLRFLCNAPHPATVNSSSGAAEVSLPGPRWEDLPSPALLRLRASLLEVVKALTGLLRYWGKGAADSKEARPAMKDAVTEAARFLTVMLLEDEGCLPPPDVIDLLPAVMGPLASERDPALLLPWVSRALSSDSEAAVAALVDVQAHLHLIDILRTDDPHLVQPDAMLLLHEILTRGAALPCPDTDSLLAACPRVLDLLPYLASAAGRAMTASKTQRSMVRVQQYSAWFCLSLMDAFPRAMVHQALPPDSAPYRALLDALVQMLVMGGNPPEFGVTGEDDSMDEEEEEEERQEVLMLWTKTVALVRSADEALQSHVMQKAHESLGPTAPERVKELLRDERSDGGDGGAAGRTSF